MKQNNIGINSNINFNIFWIMNKEAYLLLEKAIEFELQMNNNFSKINNKIDKLTTNVKQEFKTLKQLLKWQK